MRRSILLLVLVLLPAVAVGPGLVQSFSAHASAQKPTPEKKKSCPTKGKKGKTAKGKCPSTKKAKKTPTPQPLPKKSPTKTPLRPTAVPTRLPPLPPTSAPRPSSTTVSLDVRADTDLPNHVAFFACGIPTAIRASFYPNPVTATLDRESTNYAAGHSSLRLVVPRSLSPGTYEIALHAYYQTPTDAARNVSSGVAVTTPSEAVLTVDASGQASIAGGSGNPGVGLEDCTTVPDGFQPGTPPTPGPANVHLQSWLSTLNPGPGAQVTLSTQVTARGKPVSSVEVYSQWFGPYGIRHCDALTDSTGLATCTLSNTPSLPGSQVTVQVTFFFEGQQYTTYAYYTSSP